MAIRYTVYCTKSVAQVTPKQLLDGVQVADLHTIAENDDIPDDVIVDALGQLRKLIFVQRPQLELTPPAIDVRGQSTRFAGKCDH